MLQTHNTTLCFLRAKRNLTRLATSLLLCILGVLVTGALSKAEKKVQDTGYPAALSEQSLALRLSQQFVHYELRPYMTYLEDKTGELDLTDVVAKQLAGEFQKDPDSKLNFGFTDSAYWFHLSIFNDNSPHSTWVIEQGYPLMDQLTLYIYHSNKAVERFIAGDSVSFNGRSYPYANANYTITLAQGERADLYLRAQTQGAVQLPLVISSEKAFEVEAFKTTLIFGLYYGILFSLVLYNLFIYISIRDINYFYYVCYMFCYGVFQLCLNGVALQYFWPNNAGITNTAFLFFMNATMISVCLFSQSFLNLKKRMPSINHWFNTLAIVFSVLCFASFFIGYNKIIVVSTLLTLLTAMSVFIVGIKAILTGSKAARYFMLAWSIFLLGMIVYTLKSFGVLPTNVITEYAMQIGSSFEAILLSLALAYRFRLIALENETIQNQAKKNLEQRVQERTQALEVANQKLQSLSQTDGLTGVSNRRHFDAVFAEEYKRSRRSKTALSVLLIDVDHFKIFNDTWGHLRGDECLQVIARNIKDKVLRETDTIARYGGEEFAAILPQTDEENAFHIAESIRQSTCELDIIIEDKRVHVSVSIGIAVYLPENNEVNEKTAETILEQADQALYTSKREGRNRTTISSLTNKNLVTE